MELAVIHISLRILYTPIDQFIFEAIFTLAVSPIKCFGGNQRRPAFVAFARRCFFQNGCCRHNYEF